MLRPIHHTFAPLANRKQIKLALALSVQPWKWQEGEAQEALKQELGNRFGGQAHLFGSGRESLLAILKSLRFQKEEEVIVQGYTCVVVPNAVSAAGMTPVFADIERDTLNLDIDEVAKLITPRTRAIVCQHTFGIPAFTKELRSLCDRHSLILIEDCAHIIPDEHGPKEIGAYGDLLFFSFGRDKAISGVNGGAVVCRRKDICADLGKLESDAKPYSFWQIKRWLQYPVLYGITKPVYGSIGRYLLAGFGRIGMLAPIVTRKEKNGEMPDTLHRMPNACAVLVLQQWERLRQINDHRRALTRYYFDESTRRRWPLLLGVTPDLPLQKFPLFTPGAERIRQVLKRKNIHLHDGWTGCVICPADANDEACGYKDGDDPDAEMAGEQILSLPTHPDTSMDQAKRLVELLDPLLR
jgi:perosamine synthetase